jgi:hypothetical protein
MFRKEKYHIEFILLRIIETFLWMAVLFNKIWGKLFNLFKPLNLMNCFILSVFDRTREITYYNIFYTNKI